MVNHFKHLPFLGVYGSSLCTSGGTTRRLLFQLSTWSYSTRGASRGLFFALSPPRPRAPPPARIASLPPTLQTER